MLKYPVNLKDDETGAVLVFFPDFPFAHTYGDDRKDALRHAVGALETAIIACMSDRETIPRSSARRGRPLVSLGAQATMKTLIYQVMRDQGLRKADLARRLEVQQSQVARLLDLRHASRIGRLEEALRCLGHEFEIKPRKAA